jgi:hypothetical protein
MIERLASFLSSKKPKNSKIWRWLSLLLTIVMVVYLVYAFTRGELRLNQVDWKAYQWAILEILLIYLLSLIIQFYVWTRIISDHRRATLQDVEIYARTILMRSLPGGAWHWVGRISMYSGGTEVPTRVVVLANFLDWALITLDGIGIYLLTLPTSKIGIPLAALPFGATMALVINWQSANRKWMVRFAEGVLWITLYSMVWFLAAIILYVIVQAVAGAGQLDVLGSIKASTLAGSMSSLVTWFPSSLGVREISLVWLLQSKLTTSLALLIALILRIIYTLADAIWGVLGWIISRSILQKKA